jgi:transcriptional regulator MraZ
MLLTGTFARSLDEKLRIAIPKRVRDALTLGDNAHLYVAPGTDRSLALYTEEVFTQLAERFHALSPTQQDVRAYSRMLYAQAERIELDSQGRVRIPPALVQLAGLGRDVVMLGVQDHLEVWDRSRWETYLSERANHYDEIAERAFDTRSGPAG